MDHSHAYDIPVDPVAMSGANEELQKKVIVVGAGPVGLITALRLGQAGIKVDVIEKEETLSMDPRAVGYYAGALQAFKKARVFDQIKRAGFTATGFCWRKPLADDDHDQQGSRRLGDIIARLSLLVDESIDSTTMGLVFLHQRELAKLLFNEVIDTGFVTVHFQRELCAIELSQNSVTAISRTPDNKQEVFQGSFLVGADGGKSAARKLLNIQLKGHSWPERLVATDIRFEVKNIDSNFPTSIIVHPTNFGVLTPLEQTCDGQKAMYRCTMAIDPEDRRADEQLIEGKHVASLLELMLPGPRPLDVEVLRASPYRIHQLCASTFRRGRCVLAGDAAHLNNPFGGMGLGTGLLDADALADTLEMIINEQKPLTLLDIYSDERRRVFQMFVDPITTQNKLRCANDPETATEDWLLRALNNAPPDELTEFAKPYFEVWPTDMRKVVATRALG